MITFNQWTSSSKLFIIDYKDDLDILYAYREIDSEDKALMPEKLKIFELIQ